MTNINTTADQLNAAPSMKRHGYTFAAWTKQGNRIYINGLRKGQKVYLDADNNFAAVAWVEAGNQPYAWAKSQKAILEAKFAKVARLAQMIAR